MPQFFVILLSAITCCGCSLLLDLTTSQCGVDADCESLGGEFRGRVCRAGLCQVPEMEPDAAPPPECETHTDCVRQNFDSPFLCQDGACVDMRTSECPLVLNVEGLEQADPVIVGAFSFLELGLRSSPTTLNYELAAKEIHGASPGLHGGKNGTRRPMVMVLCEGVETDQDGVNRSLEHLVDTMHVPAIIATFNDTNLLHHAFTRVAKQDDIFFINPLAPNQELLREDTEGLMWSILGSWRSLASTYRPVVLRAEAFQRTVADIPEEESLRVALVSGTQGEEQDVSLALVQNPDYELRFNGKTALENDGADFQLFPLESDGSNADDITVELLAFKPHLIVSTAGEGFVQLVLPLVEEGWNAAAPGQVKPFFVLSRFAAGQGPLLATSANRPIRSRTVGINYATIEGDRLYQSYLIRLKGANPGFDGLESTENFYDVVYFLYYAMAGAGGARPLGGSDIASGMRRVISGDIDFEVGSEDVPNAVALLQANPDASVSFIGTMGAPEFNVANGARHTPSSVWCLDADNGAIQFEALRYNQEEQTLSGNFPCFDDF